MVPEWAKGMIFYQIFPDRFYNGDRENDVKTGEYKYEPGGSVRFVDDWNSLPETTDVNRFYGGDLEGVWDKLPYLKELGIEAILFNPIFKSPSNHKYDTTDYYVIDPHLTSKRARNQTEDRDLTPNEYFACFTRAVHEAGMKIILDGVFNHCGNENKWANDPSKKDYFSVDEKGERECWWGVKTLPKLNYDKSRELVETMLEIGKYWVGAPYFCDGWRLDVAADLGHSKTVNHSFWKSFCDAVKSVRPDALIFAELYEDPHEWLADGEWDSVMNYEGFMDPVSGFFTGVDKHMEYGCGELLGDAEAFAGALTRARNAFPSYDNYLAAINQLDNHDHARFITRTKGITGRLGALAQEDASAGVDYDVLRQSVVFQMTWPGSPTLYYGDETALPGFTDPDNRRTFPWGAESFELIDFYKKLIRLHKSSKALRIGECEIVCAEGGRFAFYRKYGDEMFLTVINRETEEKEMRIRPQNVAPFNEATRVFETSKGYSVGTKRLEMTDDGLLLKLPPVSSMIVKLTADEKTDN